MCSIPTTGVGGGHLKSTKTEAGLAGVEIAKSLQSAGRFRLPPRKIERKKPLDLDSVLKKKIQPTFKLTFKRIGITGVGWHTLRHSGNHAGRDGRTPIDDPRLLASQRSARDQQISPGDNRKQKCRASSWMPSCQVACCREANQP